MRIKLPTAVVWAVLVIAAFYIGDLIVLRARAAMHGNAFGTVTVHRFYRIAQKNGRNELDYDGDYVYDCARSIFPHAGDQPCWYLSRHTEQWIDIKTGEPNNPHIF